MARAYRTRGRTRRASSPRSSYRAPARRTARSGARRYARGGSRSPAREIRIVVQQPSAMPVAAAPALLPQNFVNASAPKKSQF